jgi:hypothetical protein
LIVIVPPGAQTYGLKILPFPLTAPPVVQVIAARALSGRGPTLVPPFRETVTGLPLALRELFAPPAQDQPEPWPVPFPPKSIESASIADGKKKQNSVATTTTLFKFIGDPPFFPFRPAVADTQAISNLSSKKAQR